MGRKRKNGEGTVRLRKDGRWEGRVVVGYDEKCLPRTKNVLAKTKGECVEKLAALKASVGAPTPGKARPDMPFGAWADLWLETYYKPNVKPSTQRIFEGFIRLYLKPRLGHIPLNKLTANDLQQFYVWMKNDGRTRERDSRGEGLSDNMLQNCHYLCRRVLEKAVAEGLIHQDPAAHCKLPSMTRAEMRILTREEMQKTLIQAKEEGYYEVFLLEFATGLREGELAALQWDDLNFQTGELRVSRQAGRVIGSGIVISEPKTIHSVRTLVLPPMVAEVLKRYKDRIDSRWMFPSSKKEDTPIDPATIRQRLHLLLDHAGCKQVRFHDLRHTFATNCLEYGMDVKTLSTILGHVSSATTLNVYAHVTDEMRRTAAAKIDSGIAKAEPAVKVEGKTKERAMTTFQARKRWQRTAH